MYICFGALTHFFRPNNKKDILLFGLKKCVSAPKHMQQDSFTDLLKLPIQVEHFTQLS